jgi:hypothetical protein
VFENLACSTYYAHFGPFLLNREYTLLPIAEAVRLAENLFAHYANGGQVFVCPDSVDKSFTGTLTDRATFTPKFFGTTFDPAALVLVARAKKLGHEWRLIVANGKGHSAEPVPQCRDAGGRPRVSHSWACMGKNSQMATPATLGWIGLHSPRYSDGALGFISYMSK